MKKTNIFAFTVLILFIAAFSFAAFSDKPDYAQHKHIDYGVTCQECHDTDKPTRAPVGFDQCIDCHGGYASLADTTAQFENNPHYTHLGESPCQDCHKIHGPSVYICSSCHNIQLLVP